MRKKQNFLRASLLLSNEKFGTENCYFLIMGAVPLPLQYMQFPAPVEHAHAKKTSLKVHYRKSSGIAGKCKSGLTGLSRRSDQSLVRRKFAGPLRGFVPGAPETGAGTAVARAGRVERREPLFGRMDRKKPTPDNHGVARRRRQNGRVRSGGRAFPSCIPAC